MTQTDLHADCVQVPELGDRLVAFTQAGFAP
jgi:hypothetical protein